ncbi:hypothetical protein PAGU2595_008050 [Lysobacter xanthus]
MIVMTATLLAGCAAAPAPRERPIVDGASVARGVELCRTRVAEIEARLGPPSRDGRLGRARLLTWIVDWDPLVRYLGVLADADGRVVDVVWDAPSEVPWTPVDRCR